ncbi:hypothetical protein PanWU01x14_214630 [Parasponia andersonii]|uniref:Uncharacterized protein n=1 Tax=Parasponia andersonii TaxID=3476 RepID=A0A2P5BS62_PARAD|nr:hypothetical protein PanWU01x14_214630 [Parasponia andersonii]
MLELLEQLCPTWSWSNGLHEILDRSKHGCRGIVGWQKHRRRRLATIVTGYFTMVGWRVRIGRSQFKWLKIAGSLLISGGFNLGVLSRCSI